MKRFGVTVDCYIDGSGYGDNSLSIINAKIREVKEEMEAAE